VTWLLIYVAAMLTALVVVSAACRRLGDLPRDVPLHGEPLTEAERAVIAACEAEFAADAGDREPEDERGQR
jgi:hypothetical protein